MATGEQSNPSPLFFAQSRRAKQFARKMKTRGGEWRVGAGGFESFFGGQVRRCMCVLNIQKLREKRERGVRGR